MTRARASFASIAAPLAVTLALPALATADVPSATPTANVELMSVSGSVDGRSYAEDTWMTLPDGVEAGMAMRFLTADGAPMPGMDGAALKFTDLALLGLHARAPINRRTELRIGVDLLPKQPSETDEGIWQGMDLGVRRQLGKRRMALAVNVAAGPLISNDGMWGAGALTYEFRHVADRWMHFAVNAGVGATALRPEGDLASAAWSSEASAHGTVAFRAPLAVAWVGVGYALPIAHSGDDPRTGMALEPQPRLNLQLGGSVHMVKQWDVYAQYNIVDRGEVDRPETLLPILDGGFDQKQLVVGVTYRYDFKDRE